MIKVIGTIVDTPAVLNEEGMVIIEPTYLPGWHVDTTYPVPELDIYLLDPQPTTRAHQFAGVRTYAYRFPDEQAWQQFVSDHSASDGDLILTPPKPRPPSRVTMRQARLALSAAGVLPQVDAAINALDEPQRTVARIEWDYSQEVERNRELVQLLGPALGLSDDQLDDLFREAATL
ncbi:hypothetical protein [Marinobacter salarius]|uniref:hypothetical protein n=1 Tax=Marinobacter salarius TaxID=1420917 RepID=UPI0025A41CAF|nr:hypothetical protein [Marinobacter salarius]MDM8181250.1 hypothetical protein [Marinobacter salarius]|tara:strand:+ start:3746 stop:4273 length:528 start_codon:yes stop_codon:yes gene_type:complete